MTTSIIIRVKNERENLDKLFELLKNQTRQDFEIVIVDNSSTDGSDKAVFKHFPKDRVRLVRIERFSYPKACNLGAEVSKGKYLVYLSAHSFPISKTWLEDSFSNFDNEKVAGVFAYPFAGENGTVWEKFFNIIPMIGYKLKLNKENCIGNTNSMIRRDLWEKHKFDESLFDCEDVEWSIYWKRKGYEILYDPRFAVYHSHHLSLLGIIKQEIEWYKSKKRINKKFKN